MGILFVCSWSVVVAMAVQCSTDKDYIYLYGVSKG